MREWEKELGILPGELPLDRLTPNGGFCAIFRRMAFVGDSLSSGEFEDLKEDGTRGYHDMFEYSFGQYMARFCGLTALNFSRGGMSAREYITSFAEENGFWDASLACQAYVMALGVNDLFGQNKVPLGSVEDIDPNDWQHNDLTTFAGQYAAILQRYAQIQSGAKFFLVTMPRETTEREPLKEGHAALLHQMADIFPRTYVLDLHRYAPIYDAAFKQRFYLGSHLNPAGYLLTAQMLSSYIDYIIRKSPAEFRQVGFIGTPWRSKGEIF